MNEDSIQYSGTPSLLGRSVIVINQEWCRGLKSSFILQPTRSAMTVGFAESRVAMLSHGRSSNFTSWSNDSLVCISRVYVYWKRLVYTNRVEIACLLSLFLRQDLLDPRMALNSLCSCRHPSTCVPSDSTSWVLRLHQQPSVLMLAGGRTQDFMNGGQVPIHGAAFTGQSLPHRWMNLANWLAHLMHDTLIIMALTNKSKQFPEKEAKAFIKYPYLLGFSKESWSIWL